MAKRKKSGQPQAEPKKRGRPPTYRPEFNNEATESCMLGSTNEDLARRFGVDVITIERWLREKEDFRRAVKAGREEADGKVGKSLYERAMGYNTKAVKIFVDKGEPVIVPYVEHYPPDATSMIFWLKNRRPDLWREKHEVEHSGKLSLEKLVAGSLEDDKT